MVPWAHPTQHPKRLFDRFSRCCTAHGRVSVYFTMGRPFSHNCPFARRDLNPRPRDDSLGLYEPTAQTTSRLDQPFLHSSPQSVPIYFTMGRRFPSKLPLSMGDPDPHLIHGFLGPIRVLNPNSISIGSAVFAGLTSVTERPTDRPTYHATRSVAYRPHLRT